MEYMLSNSAAHYIKTADKPTRRRLKAAIEGLLKEPPEGDIKPLKGWKPPASRLRIGGCRIIFSIRTSSSGNPFLYIQDIGSRGDIYK